jgi:uncharacterized protein (TIGR02271 family)
MDEVYVGMTVRDANGPVGTVVDVQHGSGHATIRRHDGTTHTLERESYTVYGDTLEIIGAGGIDVAARDPRRTQTLSATADVLAMDDGENVTIPVVREEVVVGTREVERGGVRVHKRVEEREETAAQPTQREDVEVERVPIGRAIEAAPEVRQEGDTLIIPVIEEMLVVQKQLVLKEEIRITKRRYTETEEVRVVLREEQVDIEQLDETDRPPGAA